MGKVWFWPDCVFLHAVVLVLAEHVLALVPVDDGLKHRPRAEWSIMYMNCELNDAEIWLKSALQQEPGKEVTMPLSLSFASQIGPAIVNI
jgi:hypothetical protein